MSENNLIPNNSGADLMDDLLANPFGEQEQQVQHKRERLQN